MKTSSYSPPQPRSRSLTSLPDASAISSTEGPLGMNDSSTSMPTPEVAHMVLSAVPRPSDRSMHDVTAPVSAIASPSATLGTGTYSWLLASSASMPSSSETNPAAGPPTGPVTATTSPGLAPERSIGLLPSMDPSAVVVTTPGPTLVSPPAIPVPQNSAHWLIPLIMSYAAWTSRSPGRTSDARIPVGRAPIAARSLKLTAAEYQPNCSYVMPAGMCLSKVTASVETTTPLPSTAASSPGPTSPSRTMNVPKSSMSCLSPISPIRVIGAPSDAGYKDIRVGGRRK